MDNIEEFSRKYSDSFVQYIYKTKKSRFAARITGVNTFDNLVILEVFDGGTISGIYPQILEHLDLNMPDSGYFNHNGFALYLFKVPARQWRRGMCSENCTFYNPFRRLFKEGVYRPLFGINTVNAVYQRSFKSPEQALELLDGKRQASCAVSRVLSLSKSPLLHKSALVWYKTNPVGLVHNHKFQVMDDLHEQEVSDELTRADYHSWIY